MNIKTIRIRNVRGLKDHTVNLNMIPNKPSLLVAPNGSGKSSFAIAFQSLKKGKMIVASDNHYQLDKNLKPKLSILTEDSSKNSTISYEADNDVNQISKEFGVAVINNRIKISITQEHTNSETPFLQSRFAIEPIIMVNNVPPQVSLSYDFGQSNQVCLTLGLIPNINKLLKCSKFYTQFPAHEFISIKRLLTLVIRTVQLIKGYYAQGISVKNMRNKISHNILPSLKSNLKLKNLADIICENTGEHDELKVYLMAIQVVLLYNENIESFKKAIEYFSYVEFKKRLDDLFSCLKDTWQNIKPEEKDGKLIITIPNATRLSNGERDIIVFLAMLEKARLMLNKQNNILIIDEIFDYLDDANMVAAQYYITNFIEKIKEEGKNIFPIILTHLNPDYYRHYAFKDMKVYYLVELPNPNKSNLMMSLLRLRQTSGKNEKISKYMLHFYCDYSCNMAPELNREHINAGWGDINKFKAFCTKNVTDYFSNSPFCPIAVCVILREWIESYCFKKLNKKNKTIFLDIHGTQKKLKFAEQCGIDIPELFYLLGIIYNEPLHVDTKKDLRQTLYSRLQNKTIMTMIRKVCELCS